MKHNLSSKRECWIDFLRIILTTLVVIGHADYYRINTAFGGIYYSDLMIVNGVQDTVIHHLIQILKSWIYSFHMPLYFALSGILFYIDLEQKRYTSLSELIRIKGRRLIIPCITVWVLWNIPVKMVTCYYEKIPVWKIFAQIIFCDKVYLWFLQSLFFSFIICLTVIKVFKQICIQGGGIAFFCFFGRDS